MNRRRIERESKEKAREGPGRWMPRIDVAGARRPGQRETKYLPPSGLSAYLPVLAPRLAVRAGPTGATRPSYTRRVVPRRGRKMPRLHETGSVKHPLVPTLALGHDVWPDVR